MVRPLRGPLILIAIIGASVSPPVAAWTSSTNTAIAEAAADLAPTDLKRQIDKNLGAYLEGVEGAARSPRTGESIATVLQDEVQRTIDGIRNHRPFSEIVTQLGIVAYYVSIANQPLNASSSDPNEPRYSADYARYMESARSRFRVSFYADGRRLDSKDDLRTMVRNSLTRGRELYPYLGREYERIGYANGVERFDDRSTAFGVSAVAYSHSISDLIGILRYIWIESGGADTREFLGLSRPTPQ